MFSHSICRSPNEQESLDLFNNLHNKLPKLIEICPNILTTELIQEIFNYTTSYPNQSITHLAAHFGISECFKSQYFEQNNLNLQCPDTGLTPLHLAVSSGKIQIIQTLLSLGAQIDIHDKKMNNVFHFAATTTKEIINALCTCSQANSVNLVKLINTINNENYSPLHLACCNDKPECVKELFKNGADVNSASIFDGSSGDNLKEFRKSDVINQLDMKDMKNGGTPLHWSKSSDCIETLLEMGCNINARNFQGETVLHVMVSKNLLPCVVTLISHGADVNAIGVNGNTPLHLAVKVSNKNR